MATGTTLSVGMDANRASYLFRGQIQGFDFESEEEGSVSSELSFTLSQRLLEGHRLSFNFAAARSARQARSVAEARRQAVRQAALADTAGAFWLARYQRALVAIAEQTLTVATEQRRVVDALVEAGRLAPVEGTRAHAAQVQGERALIEARSGSAAADDALLVLVGERPGQPLELDAPTPGVPEVRLDVAQVVEAVVQQNPDLVALRLARDQAALDLANARHGLLPSLDASLTLGTQGVDDTLPASLRRAVGDGNPSWTAGATLTVPLYNRADRGQLRSAEASLASADLDVRRLKDSLEQAARAQVRTLEAGSRNVALARLSVRLAEETLAADQARLAEGRALQKDVTDALRATDAARVEAERALTTWLVAVVELERLKGGCRGGRRAKRYRTLTEPRIHRGHAVHCPMQAARSTSSWPACAGGGGDRAPGRLGYTPAVRRLLVLLVALLAGPAYAEEPAALARALLDDGLPHSAQVVLLEALEDGPGAPAFSDALAGLVEVAAATGDATDLARIAATTPPEAFPAAVRDELVYRRGVALYERGELAQASQLFAEIGRASALYWNARFLEGVSDATRGELKSAVKAFKVVIDGAPDRDLCDLARLNVGGIYYSIQRYDDAAGWYTFPQDSPRNAESRLRLAWSRFMLSQVVEPALDGIPRDAWLPEAAYLRALAAFNTFRYPEVFAGVDTFEATYVPIEATLRAALARHANGEVVVEDVLGLFGRKRPLPAPLLEKLLRDHEVAGLLAHLALLDREERRLRRKPRAWHGGLSDTLLRALAEDRQRLRRRAGLALLQELAHEQAYLADLLQQTKVLRFEAVDATEVAARDEGRPAPDRSTALLRALIPSLPWELQREAKLRLAARVEDDAQAVALCEEVIAGEATRPWSDVDLAVYLLALSDPARRVPELTRLVATWPTSKRAPEAWLILGDDHLAHGRFADARDAYQHVAELPKHRHRAYANYKLGWALHALGDHAAGQEALGIAIEAAKDPKLRADATAEREKLGRL